MADGKERERRILEALARTKELEKQKLSDDEDLIDRDSEFNRESGILSKLLKLNPWYMVRHKKAKNNRPEE